MIEKNPVVSPSLQPSFLVDVERTIAGINQSFNPLHDDYVLDYHVQRVRDGRLILSIAMPEGMIQGFTSLLQSLHGFFRFAELKERISKYEEKAFAPGEVERRREFQTEFQQEVCRIFDELAGQGLERKEAVKRTNQALKAKKHPWATHEAVLSVLRSAGRFRKGGGKRD
jgi:uncharacterized protein (UPF0335 family)